MFTEHILDCQVIHCVYTSRDVHARNRWQRVWYFLELSHTHYGIFRQGLACHAAAMPDSHFVFATRQCNRGSDHTGLASRKNQIQGSSRRARYLVCFHWTLSKTILESSQLGSQHNSLIMQLGQVARADSVQCTKFVNKFRTRFWENGCDLKCKRGSIGQSKGLLLFRSSVRFGLKLMPKNSNWLEGLPLRASV